MGPEHQPHGGPNTCSSRQFCRAPHCLGTVSGEQTGFRDQGFLSTSQELPMEAEAPSWAEDAFSKVTSSKALPMCELLAQLHPTPVPWHTLGQGAAAGSSGQMQRLPDTQLGKQSTFHSDSPLSQAPLHSPTCTTTFGSPDWEVRERGWGSRTSLMMLTPARAGD